MHDRPGCPIFTPLTLASGKKFCSSWISVRFGKLYNTDTNNMVLNVHENSNDITDINVQ